MLKKLKKAAIATALAAVLTGSSSVAFATDDYRTGQKLLQAEHTVSTATAWGSGLACAAVASWSGFFTLGIAPALAGLTCAAIAASATKTAMRCSLDKETRIRTGLGEDCIVIAVGIKGEF